MQTDAQIRHAIRRAAAAVGSNAELARQVRLDKSTIGNYINAAVDDIIDEHWEKLYPHLREYLPAGLRYLPRSALAAMDDSATAVGEDTAPYRNDCRPEIRAVCNEWNWLDDPTRATILGVMRLAADAIKKSRSARENSSNSQSA